MHHALPGVDIISQFITILAPCAREFLFTLHPFPFLPHASLALRMAYRKCLQHTLQPGRLHTKLSRFSPLFLLNGCYHQYLERGGIQPGSRRDPSLTIVNSTLVLQGGKVVSIWTAKVERVLEPFPQLDSPLSLCFWCSVGFLFHVFVSEGGNDWLTLVSNEIILLQPIGPSPHFIVSFVFVLFCRWVEASLEARSRLFFLAFQIDL